MAGIGGITGLGSGMDIDSMVTAIVNAERAPKDSQLSRLATATTSKLSSLGTLKSGINDFQTALKTLNDPKLFTGRTATSSDTSRFTATATPTAQAGSYSIEVSKLATASKISSGTVSGTSSATFEKGGTLTVGLGSNSYDVEIADGASLKDVRDAINAKQSESGVSATIISDSVNGTSRLVLSSTKTGAGNDVSLSLGSETDADSNLSVLTTGTSSVTAASNAVFKVDGVELQSKTNEVTDAIDGVTLNLAKAETDKTATLTIGDNTAAVKTNLQKFVDAYNTLISTTKTLTSVIAVSDGNAEPLTGGLVGDSSVRNMLNSMRSALSTPGTGDLKTLTSLGITTDKDGKMSLDSTKLDKALKENYNAVGEFLTGDKGLMTRLNTSVDPYVKSGGILEGRISSLNATSADITKQKADQETRVAALQTRLYSQFNAMDSLVGQLSNTSSWLTGTLSSLPGVVKQS